jgi:beta-lactamase regulating signal transducer with metallopeptidase domain/C-terminal processing protease CtpA/Prc
MSPTLQFLNSWLARVACEGGFILLVAWLLMKLVGQPVRKLQVGIWGALAALTIAVGCTLSPWLPLRLLNPLDAGPPRPGIEPGLQPGPSCMESPLVPVKSSDSGETYFLLPADEACSPAFGGLAVPPASPAVELEKTAKAAWQPLFSFSWPQVIAAIAWLYPACIAVFAWRWLHAQATLRWIARHATPAPASVLCLANSMIGSRRAPPIMLVSDRLAIPATWGLVHPKILIPASLCAPSEESRLRCVLAHELAHIERTDALACTLLSAAQALYFFCPWFWWLRRQIRLCQEYIADARAAGQAASRADYAQLLLSFTSSEPTPQGAFGVIGRESDLFRRISMLLEDRTIESRCPRRWSIAIAMVLISSAIVMSGIGLASRASASPDDEAPAPPTPPAAPALPPVPPPPPAPPVAIAGGWLLTDPADAPKPEDESSAAEEFRKAKQEYQKAMKHWQEAQRQWARQVAEHARQIAEEQRHRIQERLELSDEDGGLGELKRMKVIARMHGGHGRLGISYSPPSATLAEQLNLPEGQGIVVTEVAKGSAAEKAGLKAHDILLEIDGHAVPRDIAELSKFVKGLKADKELEAVVLRKGQKETLKGLKLAEAKEEKESDFGEGFGRAFHAMPVPPIPPVPPVFGVDNALALHSGRGVTVTVNRDNDHFTVRRREGNLVITVTGSVSDGKSKVGKIHVKDEKNSRDYDSIDAIPDRYQEKVKHLVDLTQEEGGQIKIKHKDRHKDKDKDEDEE